MRSTTHKQKFTSALRNMQGTQNQLSVQTLEKQNADQLSISIINFGSYKQHDSKKERQTKKINPLSTFSVPHTKHQSKVIKFLIQSKHMSQESEEWVPKLKTQRHTNLSLKNKSQQSMRMQSDTKEQQRKNQENEEKGLLWREKQSTTKKQLSNLSKISQHNIIRNIKTLKKKQTMLIYEQDQIDVNSFFSTQQQLSKMSQVLIEENRASSLVYCYEKEKQEEALYKLKMHVKNKILRRRMYYASKQTYEPHRIVPKTNKVTDKSFSGSFDFIQSETRQNLHKKKVKRNIKSLQVRTFKNYTAPVFSAQPFLKVQSKTPQIVCGILKCKQQYMKSSLQKIQKSLNIVNRNKTINAFGRTSNPEQNSSFQAKKKVNKHTNKAKLEIKGKKEPQVIISEQGPNVFRQLTPWRNDEYE